MKILIGFLLIVFGMQLLPGQSCLTSGIVFSNQQDIDNFPLNFPGCSIIEGSLGISGSAVLNLDSLIYLTEVKGSIQILGATNLTSLQGLNNLKKVDGQFRCISASLTNFNGLDSLRLIGSTFKVQLAGLVNFQGISKLHKIGGNFELTLPSTSFIDFTGLSALDTIIGGMTGDLRINSFTGLNNLKYIGGSLNLGNGPIYSLAGLENLRHIGGLLNLYRGRFFNLDPLQNLDSVFSLTINNCDSLRNINALQDIQTLYFLHISGNQKLENITGLANLHTVINSININHINPSSILDLSPFSTLTNFKGSLFLSGRLGDFSVFNNIDTLTTLSISSNPIIGVISGFDSLKTITGQLSFSDNSTLTAINGIQNLINLGSLSIKNNPFLFSLAGLNHEFTLENTVTIQNNSLLSDCDIVPLCYKFWLSGLPNSNTISGNGPGCNTFQEIFTNCGAAPDQDNDGINDLEDNCPAISNSNQLDCNTNGIGDVCENFFDNDCDGLENSIDNCPSIFNPFQHDHNNNSIGDACEEFSKLGFGIAEPKVEYHFSNGSIYLDNPEKQLILKKQNGECYTLKIVGDVIQPQTITCPQ